MPGFFHRRAAWEFLQLFFQIFQSIFPDRSHILRPNSRMCIDLEGRRVAAVSLDHCGQEQPCEQACFKSVLAIVIIVSVHATNDFVDLLRSRCKKCLDLLSRYFLPEGSDRFLIGDVLLFGAILQADASHLVHAVE